MSKETLGFTRWLTSFVSKETTEHTWLQNNTILCEMYSVINVIVKTAMKHAAKFDKEGRKNTFI